MQHAVPVTRRFAIDLTQSTCLEFLEIIRFADNKTVVFLRHFLHTPDYTLPVVAAARLHGPPEPGHPFGRVLMKATIRETANCPSCCRAANECACIFDLTTNRAAPLTLTTNNWSQYAASFIRKSRLGMASFALSAVVPQVGEVELYTTYVPARTLLKFGDSPYMRRMQRRAVHELGVNVHMPRLDDRVQSVANATDWTRRHEAYIIRKRPREADEREASLSYESNHVVPEALVRAEQLPSLSEQAYDVPPETISVLPDFFAETDHRRPLQDSSPNIYIPSPLLGPDEEKTLAKVVGARCAVTSNSDSTTGFLDTTSSYDTNISVADVTAIADVVESTLGDVLRCAQVNPSIQGSAPLVSAPLVSAPMCSAPLAMSSVTVPEAPVRTAKGKSRAGLPPTGVSSRAPFVTASSITQPGLANGVASRIPNAESTLDRPTAAIPPTGKSRVAPHTAASCRTGATGNAFSLSASQNIASGWGFSESSAMASFGMPLSKRAKPASEPDFDSDESRKHECTKCDARFKMRGDLLRHVRTVHERKKSYTCTTCGKMFGHSGHLNRHVESVHKKLRRHKCGLCGDQFFQASHLQSHVAHVHNHRRPFECKFCYLRLATESGLRNHLKNLHNATNLHVCPDHTCAKGFLLESDLRRHVRREHAAKSETNGAGNCGAEDR